MRKGCGNPVAVSAIEFNDLGAASFCGKFSRSLARIRRRCLPLRQVREGCAPLSCDMETIIQCESPQLLCQDARKVADCLRNIVEYGFLQLPWVPRPFVEDKLCVVSGEM